METLFIPGEIDFKRRFTEAVKDCLQDSLKNTANQSKEDKFNESKRNS